MSLPYELTTFPSEALEILRYLSSRDDGAGFDGEIMEALEISERAFGKAIRRLVTKEYVEMNYDGSYGLTRRGRRAAEALSEYAQTAGEEEEAIDLDAEAPASVETITRRLMVVFPAAIPAEQPAYLFVRVDGPQGDDQTLPAPVEVMFRLNAGFPVAPDQLSVAAAPDGPSPAARFELRAPSAGTHAVAVEVTQVGMMDLIEAGVYEVEITAVTGAAADSFRAVYFDLPLQPGI